MVVGLSDIAVFTSLMVAGLAWRRHPDVHKRLMLLGTIGGLIWPAVTRMPVIAGRFPAMFGLLATLVLGPAVRDFMTGSRARWLTLWVGIGFWRRSRCEWSSATALRGARLPRGWCVDGRRRCVSPGFGVVGVGLQKVWTPAFKPFRPEFPRLTAR
jgi:hypothetical protein